MESVDEFKYLGHYFNYCNNFKFHIESILKKAVIVMKQTWSICKRNFPHNFNMKIYLFNYLVKSIALYSSEVWGWIEYKELEKLQEKYIKWSLDLDRSTPGYITMAETDLDKK